MDIVKSKLLKKIDEEIKAVYPLTSSDMVQHGEGVVSDVLDAVVSKEDLEASEKRIIDTIVESSELKDFDALIEGKLTELKNDRVTSINSSVFYFNDLLEIIDLPNITSINKYGFYHCTALKTVNVPNLITISSDGFTECTSLETLNLPNLTSTATGAFRGCTSLKSINLPNLTKTDGYTFYNCTSLEIIDLPNINEFGYSEFSSCTSLLTAIIRSSQIPLTVNPVFEGTPIADGTGYIYVPDDLVEDYKADANWSKYASQIKPISELPSND